MNLWGIIKGLLAQDATDRSKELSLEIDPAATTGTRTTLKAAQTANRTITLPDASVALIGASSVDVLTNKTIDADLNTITNIENADIKAAAAIDASKIADGSVSNAEYQRLDGVTSNIQTQLNSNSSSISTHISNPTAAHAASAISNTPSGNLSATNVQSALNELQTDIDGFVSGSGVTTVGVIDSQSKSANGLVIAGGANIYAQSADASFPGMLTIGAQTVAGAKNFSTSLQTPDLTLGNPGNGNSKWFSGSTQLAEMNGNSITLPSGVTPIFHLLGNVNSSNPIAIVSANSVGATTCGINIESGNSTGGGATGGLLLRTGTTGGTRGKIKLVDGSEGTTGHIWTSTDTVGNGHWAAPAGATVIGSNLIVGAVGSLSGNQYNMDCDTVVVKNSSNGIAVISNPTLVQPDPFVAGPAINGRDQAGTFSTGWVYAYYIWNGTTLAGILSANPPSTGPNLPAGYTYWAFFGAVFYSGGLTDFYQRGSWIYYTSPVNIGTSTSNTISDASLANIIPPVALRYSYRATGTLTSTAGGLADLGHFVHQATGLGIMTTVNVSLSGLGASQTQTLFTEHIILPNHSNTHRHTTSAASGTSPSVQMRCLGYNIPNGGE